MRNKRFFQSLFWKIGGTFLLILIILSAVYIYISVHTAEMYFKEANEKLNAAVAPLISRENQCFINGEANEKVLQTVFHNVMIINPNIEVYLLNTKGKILTYFAPNKKIQLKYVPLAPILKLVDSKNKPFVLGVDPKNIDQKKAFSAAKVFENGKLMGYIYVILESEEYDTVNQLIFGSYILRLGLRSMTITLFAAILISLISIGFITRNIRKIVFVVREFKNGNTGARINLKGKSELGEFAGAFNEMADTIAQNMEDLKTMDNLRRELVANVSHDLRTPLATIRGYIETIMIKSDKLSEVEKRNYMEIILKSTERLKKLVEELFELSKLEARETKPKPEPFSIGELVQDIQQKNLIIAESKEIKLKLDFSYDLPYIYADIAMMEKVIQNLLDNAIKFTPENGEILISLKEENEYIRVNIKDSGSGIKQEDLNHIFDRYHKISRTDNDKNEGLGLGLAIVKKILEVHDIDIKVKSSKSGTEFSFDIPIYKSIKKSAKEIQFPNF